jgi:hypothetical protein
MKSDQLYVLECNGYYKIGITNNITNRLKSLQTGNAHEINVIHIEERYKPEKAEKYLHQKFSNKRLKGEWFKEVTLHEILVALKLFLDQPIHPEEFN